MSEQAEPPAKNRGGRPRKDPVKGRRGNYSFRMSEAVRAQLSAKAEENGRSISEEVEYRIEQSLQKDGRLQAVMTLVGGADLVLFASMVNGDLRGAIEQANAQVGGKLEWYESPEKIEIVRRHMQDVAGRTAETFARLVQNGVASRTGQHMLKLDE